MKNKSTLLFDLDGTLFNSFEGIKESLIFALNKTNNPIPDNQFLSKIAGPPLKDILNELNFSEENINNIVEIYIKYYSEIGWKNSSLFPNVEKTLIHLKNLGFTLAIATSKNKNNAIKMLKHYNLLKYFDYISGANDDGSNRNKVDVINNALINLNKLPSDAIMIGDRIFDITGAHHWNIPVIYVNWGYGSKLEMKKADCNVDSFEDLVEIITNGK